MSISIGKYINPVGNLEGTSMICNVKEGFLMSCSTYLYISASFLNTRVAEAEAEAEVEAPGSGLFSWKRKRKQ